MATKIFNALFISFFPIFYTVQHCNASVKNSTSVVSSGGVVGQKLNQKNNIRQRRKDLIGLGQQWRF